jgi:hypothetical protein
MENLLFNPSIKGNLVWHRDITLPKIIRRASLSINTNRRIKFRGMTALSKL